MSIFDECKITPEYLVQKYKATNDKQNIFRIRLFTYPIDGSYYWMTSSYITINLDRNEVFVSVFKEYHTKSGFMTPIKERLKYYDITDSIDLDILIHKYSDMLIDYTVSLQPTIRHKCKVIVRYDRVKRYK